MRMFNKILIANRGEIAIRVMRACRELGIPSVAVYSEADKNALFAKYADEAVFIGPSPSSQSYLKIDNIIKAALETGAEAIHPGYGFLSENTVFASTCKENGIVFIGPPSTAIDAMGSKITARQTMKEAGVPIVPGIEEGINDPDEAMDLADGIGYPIILKPAAGGGGIGMKIVGSREEMLPALTSSQSVARNAFGDDTIYIEKYLTEPRHIEFQILADEMGKTIYVSDRECSIQRRHQKLIEESPSPVMSDELRERMGSIAVKAAKAIGYASAGTVEFMYSRGDFYFLEMNTRLQVEHPITEQITGMDIVQEQIRIAAGHQLSMTQNEVLQRGYAIEFRINAEDPQNDFLPSFGRITRYYAPGGPGVRTDSAIYTGYTIPPDYDSLCAKLTVWALDWPAVLQRAKRALMEMRLFGVKTTIPFYIEMLKSEELQRGTLHTGLLAAHPEWLNYSNKSLPQHKAAIIAATLAALHHE